MWTAWMALYKQIGSTVSDNPCALLYIYDYNKPLNKFFFHKKCLEGKYYEFWISKNVFNTMIYNSILTTCSLLDWKCTFRITCCRYQLDFNFVSILFLFSFLPGFFCHQIRDHFYQNVENGLGLRGARVDAKRAARGHWGRLDERVCWFELGDWEKWREVDGF